MSRPGDGPLPEEALSEGTHHREWLRIPIPVPERPERRPTGNVHGLAAACRRGERRRIRGVGFQIKALKRALRMMKLGGYQVSGAGRRATPGCPRPPPPPPEESAAERVSRCGRTSDSFPQRSSPLWIASAVPDGRGPERRRNTRAPRPVVMLAGVYERARTG